MEIHYAVEECYLGKILVAVGEDGLCAVLLGTNHEEMIGELRAKFSKDVLTADIEAVRDTLGRVAEFVESAGNISELDVRLDVQGTEFQRRIWSVLKEIPVGETRTYSEVAGAIGSPKSVRAVASACGANKFAVVIPCHRVVAKDGGLSGYRWGVERKRALLERERELLSESSKR